jgi:hypothetical protein
MADTIFETYHTDDASPNERMCQRIESGYAPFDKPTLSSCFCAAIGAFEFQVF